MVTKKSIQAKTYILKHSKSFGGELNNEQCWKLAGISKDTFYKYKKELDAEAFRPVQSDSQTSEWYSYFENDVLELENTHKKILAG